MQSAFLYLIDTVFSIYISIVLLRLILQLVRADFYNPLSQLIVKATNPILIPLRKVIPGLGGIDWASLVLAIALIVAKITLMTVIALGVVPGPLAVALFSVRELILSILHIFLFSIIAQAILSWIPQMHHHPITGILHQITRPILKPIQRFIPPMGGFDLSPLIALIAIQFVIMAITGR